MKIISFNVLSNRSSRYILAGKRSETPGEYQTRYNLIFDKLKQEMLAKIRPDVICLQEITQEFTLMMLKFLKQNKDLGYWFVFHPKYFQQGCLIDVRRYRYQTIPHRLYLINRYHKIQLLSLFDRSSSNQATFFLANLHLSGDLTEEGSRGRRLILNEVIKEMKKHGWRSDEKIILVGDYNDELKLLVDDEFKRWLKTNHLTIYNGNNKITSYHQYNYVFDQIEKKLVFQGIEEDHPYKVLDQIIHSTSLQMFKQTIKPPEGLLGLQVPYKHQIDQDGEIINLPNYQIWPSDHAMMIYQLIGLGDKDLV